MYAFAILSTQDLGDRIFPVRCLTLRLSGTRKSGLLVVFSWAHK